MSTSYLNLCVKFRKLVGISGTGPTAVTGQSGMFEKITIWIADADELVQRKWEDWAFLYVPKVAISAVSGTATYSLATLSITDHARWKKSSFVRDPGGDSYQKLAYDMSYDEYLESEEYLGASVSGAVERVIIDDLDGDVILYPNPSANVTIWAGYFKTVDRLAANDDTTLIPVRFEDAIFNRAKMLYAEHLEDPALYQSAKSDYDEVMTKLEASQLPAFRGQQTAGDDMFEDVVVY